MAERRKQTGHTDESWQNLSLSSVRTVSAIAAADGKAVLWGNDVCPNAWAETFGVALA